MKYPEYSLFLFVLLLMTGCKDDVNLKSFNQESRLVVYCFPSPGDTTYVRVTRSIPVRYYADSVRVAHVDDASVVYTVNGRRFRPVRQFPTPSQWAIFIQDG